MPPSTSRNLTPSSLLNTARHDDETRSLHSDQDSDDSDDSILAAARNSAEIRNHDRGVLLEEDERDAMVTAARRNRGRSPSGLKSILGKALPTAVAGDKLDVRSGRREKRAQRRRDRKKHLVENATKGEDHELMYEMEEGGMKEGSSTGESSDTDSSLLVDREGIRHLAERAKKRKFCGCSCGRIFLLHCVIAVGFSILFLGAWRLSLGRKTSVSTIDTQDMLSNGTALFSPTTIVVSLDGFRADFLQRGLTPRLNAFIKEGVSPLYMTPSFPSVTFPNHYTMVTGLYPESHGIVGNTFWDPQMEEEFHIIPGSLKSKWWGGEPIWVTAEEQGVHTGIHMWPGSEAHIMDVRPTFLDPYNGEEKLSSKTDRVLGLLDLPGKGDPHGPESPTRPQLILMYVPDVDSDGHIFGPNSTEIRETISSADNMLERLFLGLEARNLTQIVNVIVVSDHGMATTSVDRLIQLEDLVDVTKVEHTDGWPLYGLRPKDPLDLEVMHQQIVAKTKNNSNVDVYLRDVDMPERYHFSNNERIAPLWIVPKAGWAIVTKDEFDVEDGKAKGLVYHPKGLHGYDFEHPLMRAIFIARGPAFPHVPNSRMAEFQNIEVYNIVCDSIHIIPKPNNGTIRLPFEPIGIHSPETTLETPVDPVPTSVVDDELSQVISISPIESSSAADPNVRPPVFVGVDEPEEGEEGDEAADEKPQEGEGGSDPKKPFWEDLWDKITSWVDNLTHKHHEPKAQETAKA